MAFDYDLFIIGAGSGGVRAARIAGQSRRPGGHRRGEPGRRHLRHPRLRAQEAAGLRLALWRGLRGRRGLWLGGPRPTFDWARLIANKDKEIDRLNAAYKSTLAKAGAELIEGRAELIDRNTIAVGGKQVTAEVILIATGSLAGDAELPGIEHAISSNECFHLEKLPERVVVVGGGYIALEFAGIFNGLGAKATVLYRGEQVLRGFDDDVRQFLQDELAKKGIDVRCRTDVARIDKAADGLP